MTLLDAAVLALLLLIGAGGYHQGLIRGLTRTAALLAIGMLSALLSATMTLAGSIESLIARTLTLCGGVLLVVGTLTWLINRLVPRAFHRTLTNRVLGILPGLIQGLIVLILALGFVHRVALDQTTQEYIARGVITGPLIQPFDWFERTLAGVQ
ncbi:MAG TPA: hypothetical protein VFZ66_24760 [Herpetosiphonaceae bacterium]